MVTPYVTVEAPPRPRRTGGIYSVANIVDLPAGSRLAGGIGVEWTGNGCSPEYQTATDCWGMNTPGNALGPKDERGEIVDDTADSFSGYYAVECFLTGTSDDYDTRARAGLEEAEDRFIEQTLADKVFGSTGGQGSGALNQQIVAAESWADTFSYQSAVGYIARPVLWMARGQATYAYQNRMLIATGDGLLYTPNGVPVVASAAFPFNAIYISGMVTVFRSPIVNSRAVDPTHNRSLAIAERGYAVGFDCLDPLRFPLS